MTLFCYPGFKIAAVVIHATEQVAVCRPAAVVTAAVVVVVLVSHSSC